MLDQLLLTFSYGFMTRALIAGLLVSLCAALLGVCLVLKRYSMIGDGLSHVGFGALSIAMALNMAPLAVSVPVVVVAAFWLLRLSENSKIQGDAAIALVSSSALALGVIVTSLSGGMNADVHNYMFGSILAMSKSDMVLSVILSVVVLFVFILLYHNIFAVTFDEAFARATGANVKLYNMLLAFLTAITVVVGMRMMGAMLMSSLIIYPALTSMRLFKSFRAVVLCAAASSMFCFFTGMLISALFSIPAGASVVAVSLLVFFI
ncbi:MAG: metal ABC transporter permease, partial [Clostridia bacterium]|nr:metal ABC transporter permease [Clostridia bacterium]